MVESAPIATTRLGFSTPNVPVVIVPTVPDCPVLQEPTLCSLTAPISVKSCTSIFHEQDTDEPPPVTFTVIVSFPTGSPVAHHISLAILFVQFVLFELQAELNSFQLALLVSVIKEICEKRFVI